MSAAERRFLVWSMVACFFGAIMTATGHCEDGPPHFGPFRVEPLEPPTRPNVLLPFAIYAGGNLADRLTTRGALARGAQEANPVVRWTGLDTAKLASTALLVFADVKLQKRSKAAPWILRGLTAGAYTAVALHNHRMSRGPR